MAYSKGLKRGEIKLELDISEESPPSEGNRTETVPYISSQYILGIHNGRSDTIYRD